MQRFRAPLWLAALVIGLLVLGATGYAAQQTATLQPGDTLDASCPTKFGKPTVSAHAAHLACATGTPSATSGPTSAPTLLPTVIPTLAPTLSPTTGPVLIEGVPICTDHDPTKWHPLVKRDANNAITCTYGHEHHDNPASVDDIFGPPSAWYGGTQSISYPWMTISAAGSENNVKHEGYKWYVMRDVPCVPAWAPPNDGCIVAWRVEVHTLGTVADATVRFHSFSMEALVNYHGQLGIIRGGGHMDTGYLGLLVDQGDAVVCPPIVQDPADFTCKANGTFRESASVNAPAPHTDHWTPLVNWYAAHAGGAQVGPMLEPFAAIDFANPTVQLPQHDLAANNSRGRIENMAASAGPADWLPIGPDGLVNYQGYEDRLGTPVTGCTAPSVDCVPLVIEHAAPYPSLMNANQQTATQELHEHDELSSLTGKSLIRMPN